MEVMEGHGERQRVDDVEKDAALDSGLGAAGGGRCGWRTAVNEYAA